MDNMETERELSNASHILVWPSGIGHRVPVLVIKTTLRLLATVILLTGVEDEDVFEDAVEVDANGVVGRLAALSRYCATPFILDLAHQESQQGSLQVDGRLTSLCARSFKQWCRLLV